MRLVIPHEPQKLLLFDCYGSGGKWFGRNAPKIYGLDARSRDLAQREAALRAEVCLQREFFIDNLLVRIRFII